MGVHHRHALQEAEHELTYLLGGEVAISLLDLMKELASCQKLEDHID